MRSEFTSDRFGSVHGFIFDIAGSGSGNGAKLDVGTYDDDGVGTYGNDGNGYGDPNDNDVEDARHRFELLLLVHATHIAR